MCRGTSKLERISYDRFYWGLLIHMIRLRGHGIITLGRRIAERADRLYAKSLRLLKMTGPVERVVVVGIYRDAEPIGDAVRELKRSRHDVEVRLGSMDAAAPELADVTAGEDLHAGKFQNMNVLLEGVRQSDWLVIIDDDVILPSGFLDQAIEVCRRLDYALAQPAQTRLSNANWSIAKQRLFTIARDSLFVEIGPVTLLRADAQRLLVPFPADLRYGWGLDLHWAKVIQDAGLRAGIIDALAVVHASRAVASTYSWDAAQAEGQEYLKGVAHLPPSIGEGRGIKRHFLLPRA